MPVAGIRKLLSSLMIIMVFISCIPICIHNLTHNSKYTNFTEEYDNDNILTHNEDDEREKEVLYYFAIFQYILLFFIVCFLFLKIFMILWRKRIQDNLYLQLFRNQDNEPAVHYRDNGITYNGRVATGRGL